jgi:hypothetical protein
MKVSVGVWGVKRNVDETFASKQQIPRGNDRKKSIGRSFDATDATFHHVHRPKEEADSRRE